LALASVSAKICFLSCWNYTFSSGHFGGRRNISGAFGKIGMGGGQVSCWSLPLSLSPELLGDEEDLLFLVLFTS